MKLSNKTLAQLPISKPSYDRDEISVGIVHFGVGGFHRAHQAMYIDRLLEKGATWWGICGVGIMPADRKMAEVMAAQDGLYTLLLENPDGGREARVIGSIVDYRFAPDDPEAVIELLAAPTTRIISLTITEGGYNIDNLGDGVVSSAWSPRRLHVAATEASRRRRSCPATTSRATARWPGMRSPRMPIGCTRASVNG